MKKYKKILLFCGLLAVMTGFTSCESYLDKTEASDIDPNDAFKNFFNFQGFVEELYHCIPDFANQQYNNSFNWGEEEHYSVNGVNQGILVSGFDRGNFWAWQVENNINGSTGVDGTWLDVRNWTTGFNNGDEGNTRWAKGLWPLCWYGINKTNLGLANLEKLAATTEEKNLIEGQLLFFRGWFHFQMIQYFGGLPYIDKVPDVGGEIILPRESYHECADKAAVDFRRAADLLPLHWDDYKEWLQSGVGNNLRINKIMALAYLGKNYLWAGSPLMNKESTGEENYNIEYCKKSAEAFGELLALVEGGQTKYELLTFSNYTAFANNYSSLWRTNNGLMPGAKEAIFSGPYYGGTGWSMHHQYLAAYRLFSRSWSFYPTANYANYFGMVNGLPINEFVEGQGHLATVADEISGYNPSFPWKDRDPRFYVTYAIDTEKMISGGISMSGTEEWRYASLYTYDVADKDFHYRDPAAGSTTGYLLKKFNPLGFNDHDKLWTNHVIHIPWVRLADVYLMYAEAVAKGYEHFSKTALNYTGLTALDAVNKVRNRVILPDGTPLPGIQDKYLTSVEGFMSELRRERAVELAFEGHRFNDLRRWLLLIKPPYTYKTSLEFTRKSKTRFNKNDPTKNEILNLREEIIFERKFEQKHYWLPLKRNDVNLYPEFYQNPGWR